MRIMCDSVSVGDLPANATMIAAYANGRYANYVTARARFPRAIVLGVSVNADHAQMAHVLDIERGDASPASFFAWASAMANQGVRRPTAYCSRSTIPSILALRPHPSIVVDVWAADWTGHPHTFTEPGANIVAVQYSAPGHGSAGHYDVSAVWDDTWHPVA